MGNNKETKGRIGVMTWFSYRNYGTVLQALALQVVLRKLGYEGRVINYGPRLGVKTHEPAAERTFLRKVQDKVRWNLGYQPVVTDERESAFDSFIIENIPWLAQWPRRRTSKDSAGISTALSVAAIKFGRPAALISVIS